MAALGQWWVCGVDACIDYSINPLKIDLKQVGSDKGHGFVLIMHIFLFFKIHLRLVF